MMNIFMDKLEKPVPCEKCKHYDHFCLGCNHKNWNKCRVIEKGNIIYYKFYETY